MTARCKSCGAVPVVVGRECADCAGLTPLPLRAAGGRFWAAPAPVTSSPDRGSAALVLLGLVAAVLGLVAGLPLLWPGLSAFGVMLLVTCLAVAGTFGTVVACQSSRVRRSGPARAPSADPVPVAEPAALPPGRAGHVVIAGEMAA